MKPKIIDLVVNVEASDFHYLTAINARFEADLELAGLNDELLFNHLIEKNCVADVIINSAMTVKNVLFIKSFVVEMPEDDDLILDLVFDPAAGVFSTKLMESVELYLELVVE